MGTNYYWIPEPPARPLVRVIKRADATRLLSIQGWHGRGWYGQSIHIGKSSVGWVFALRVYNSGPHGSILSLADWSTRWRYGYIVGGYGAVITPGHMYAVITDRVVGRVDWSTAENVLWLAQNSAVPGPHGLVRTKIDGKHCIAHGPGTWDLHAGEFSWTGNANIVSSQVPTTPIYPWGGSGLWAFSLFLLLLPL
jgi:hypothetical protein